MKSSGSGYLKEALNKMGLFSTRKKDAIARVHINVVVCNGRGVLTAIAIE